MVPIDAYTRHRRRVRAFHLGAIFALVLLLAHLLDMPAHAWILFGEDQEAAKRKVERTEWYHVLRQGGGLWAWLGIAIIVALCPPKTASPGPGERRHGVEFAFRIVGATAAAGLLAEIFKRIFVRERPGEVGDWYSFQPWLEGVIHGKNLGLPSSHAAVAFAGATVLAAMLPRAAPVFWFWAVGCGVSRMMTGAHWLSDVALGAMIGIVVGLFLRPEPEWETRRLSWIENGGNGA